MLMYEKNGRMNIQFNGSKSDDVKMYKENDQVHVFVGSRDLSQPVTKAIKRNFIQKAANDPVEVNIQPEV